MSLVYLNLKDYITIILISVSTAIGVSFPFLPSSLPGPLSYATLAAIAVFLAAIAAFLQVQSSEEMLYSDDPEEEVPNRSEPDISEKIIQMPSDVYERRLEQARRSGVDNNPVERKNTRVQSSGLNIDNTNRLEEKIEEIESEINKIEEPLPEESLSEINERLNSLEEEIKEINGNYIDNFELNERLSELQTQIDTQKNYIRTIHKVLKENVEDYNIPEQAESEESLQKSSNLNKSVETEEETQ